MPGAVVDKRRPISRIRSLLHLETKRKPQQLRVTILISVGRRSIVVKVYGVGVERSGV